MSDIERLLVCCIVVRRDHVGLEGNEIQINPSVQTVQQAGS